MSDDTVLRILLALVTLLVAAKLAVSVFGRLRFPPVISEIIGGLLLGPTLFGVLFPDAQRWLFPTTGPVSVAIDVTYQLGMLLLMFLAGAEMRSLFVGGDRRMVWTIAAVGLVMPFVAGLAGAHVIDLSPLLGEAGDTTALTLVVAVAASIASIPVISRIMLDLRIMSSQFARTVISIAVLEDIVLNVVIAVAVGMVSAHGAEAFGAVSLLGIESHLGVALFHMVVTIAFLGAAVLMTRFTRFSDHPVVSVLRRTGTVLGPISRPLTMTLLAACACLYIGIPPILGAFAVGLSAGRTQPDEGVAPIRGFATAFFIPLYFGAVGLKLDLVHHFDIALTAGFIMVTFLLKAGGTYLGARLAGAPRIEGANYAAALNARGGPGIVLATVAFDAGIVSERFFTTLVLTAIITSLMAAWWLQAALRRKWLVVDEVSRTASPR